ncbi:Outer membrane protein IcsA autotransporter precursor [Aminobacter sp. MSH1]|uniref:autotransporter family protein n=1 Tax=Aminobacter sp. MSH1 TaxID=374606 RepID=UPI000D36C1B7|nr:autotransporter outer membrane beta-barrel domain-containing protein [Aminobacter sp. MSH1]AWC24725.1 Outer membrane protein IcsA autotransporter precursor [Aminobacter sp. MSH1]
MRIFHPAPARFGWLASTAMLLLGSTQAGLAACDLTPTAGNSIYVCDSGVSGGLTDTNGTNTLTMPGGGAGTINGNVVFGGFVDRVEVHSGAITGNVQQGGGSDDFLMSGGQIQSLSQGDGLDTFFMSGGRIVDFFEDGDTAYMTGGRIGRVNMKLDDNLFDMSGGTIDKNLVTGFGNDTIILSGGTIGGNISVSGGTDSVTVTGGSVGGSVLLSVGADTFTWDGGGIIYGTVDLGGDNDTAMLSNLSNANIGATVAVNGGDGTDGLTFDNVSAAGIARFQNWEMIDATNDTELTFDGNLVLGDAGTGTGTLTVDATSTLFGGGQNASVLAVSGLANVINAGRIDLTNGGGGTGDTFTINGNYQGNGGLLFLDAMLGSDGSASDKLVISGGTATGSTGIEIVNAGGAGGLTVADGILVVEAIGGATTGGAFALASRVAAGAYEYMLFKGDAAGAGQNWYLRSTMSSTSPEPAPGPSPIEPNPQPAPVDPETAPPPPTSALPPVLIPGEGDPVTPPTDPTPPVLPGDTPPEAPPVPPVTGEPTPPPPTETPQLVLNPAESAPLPNPERLEGGAMPLFRGEVPTYAVISPLAHYLAMTTLGTFHERRGEQPEVQGAGQMPAAWGRVFGQSVDMSWTGTLTPSFDGTLFGMQAGLDIYGWETDSGHHDRIGLFVGHTRISGDVKSPTIAGPVADFGDINANGTSLGANWTHVGPGGWYLDAVLMGTWFGGDVTSSGGENLDVGGTGVTASLEGGYPIALTPEWTLEPQGQLVWQHLSLDDQADSFSTVSFNSDDVLTGRLGVRLQGLFQTEAATLKPYLKANIWHEFDGEGGISLGGDPIAVETGGTSVEFGGGVIAKLSEQTSMFATADYTTNIGGEKKRVFEGNVGLSVKW